MAEGECRQVVIAMRGSSCKGILDAMLITQDVDICRGVAVRRVDRAGQLRVDSI